MNYLSQGMESKKKILLLFQLTNISSEGIKQAILDHLTKNFSVSHAAMLNDVKQPNVARAVKSLNDVAMIVEKINELNLYRSSDINKKAVTVK